MFALSVRVPSHFWAPVFYWVFFQALLLEQNPLGPEKAIVWALWLVLYGAFGIGAWFVVEKRRRRSRVHVWRRAAFSWLTVQILICLLLTALVQIGLLYE